MYYVYIIYSREIDRYYVGSSVDPEERLKYHNLGKGGNSRSYTKRARDWRIVWERGFTAKNEARRAESEIKKQKSKKYIEKLVWARSSTGRASGSYPDRSGSGFVKGSIL